MSRAFYDEVHARYGDPATFVQRIRAKLRLHGISQGRLAERSGHHPTHVSRWLGKNPSVRPDMYTMVLLDEALDRILQGD